MGLWDVDVEYGAQQKIHNFKLKIENAWVG